MKPEEDKKITSRKDGEVVGKRPVNSGKRSGDSLKLPFSAKRKEGAGEWIYRHRVGLLATVVVYLIIMIAFLSYRILIKPIPVNVMEIEFVDDKPEEKLIEEQKQEQMEQLEMMRDFKIANAVSKDDSKFDKTLKDDRKSNTSQIYDEAERVQRELAAGQDAYQKGLAELEAMNKKKNSKTQKDEQQANDSGKDEKRERAKINKNVTVSYVLENRTDVNLYVPAYQCEGGGQVVVAITVNRNGKVTDARVSGATNVNDACLAETAIQAAKATTFNTSINAPEKQKGTITYIFVPQS